MDRSVDAALSSGNISFDIVRSHLESLPAWRLRAARADREESGMATNPNGRVDSPRRPSGAPTPSFSAVAAVAVCVALAVLPPVARAAEEEPPADGGQAVAEGRGEKQPEGVGVQPGNRVLCAYRLEQGRQDEPAGEEESGSGADAAAAADCPPRHSAGLGQRLAVRVRDLGALLDDAGSCTGLVLFLDGLALQGTGPSSCNREANRVVFPLLRDAADDRDWHALLGSPRHLSRRVRVSVGTSEHSSIPTNEREFELVILSPPRFYLFCALLVVGTALFVWLIARTRMLRDRPPAADDRETPPPEPRELPFSLARFQMALWFYLAISAYAFIWMVLGELDSLTPSVLALIGISSGTALGASLIDGNKERKKKEAESRADVARKLMGGGGGGELDADDPAAARRTADLRMRMARYEVEAAVMEGAVKRETKGFVRDLLSDGGGISLHRFQVFGWTLVLGMIFVASVYRHLAMPDFSAPLLALMGISSGTYLGFKVPERPGAEGGGSDEPSGGAGDRRSGDGGDDG